MPAFLHAINPLYSLSGLVVGVLVGLTGVGGGSLMTPILVLLFGIHPATAVGTDLLYAAPPRPAARWCTVSKAPSIGGSRAPRGRQRSGGGADAPAARYFGMTPGRERARSHVCSASRCSDRRALLFRNWRSPSSPSALGRCERRQIAL